MKKSRGEKMEKEMKAYKILLAASMLGCPDV